MNFTFYEIFRGFLGNPLTFILLSGGLMKFIETYFHITWDDGVLLIAMLILIGFYYIFIKLDERFYMNK